MPIVDENRKQPYSDTPKPKVFGASSPFDPQIFAIIDEFADGKAGIRFRRWMIAAWLEGLSDRGCEKHGKGSGEGHG